MTGIWESVAPARKRARSLTRSHTRTHTRRKGPESLCTEQTSTQDVIVITIQDSCNCPSPPPSCLRPTDKNQTHPHWKGKKKLGYGGEMRGGLHPPASLRWAYPLRSCNQKHINHFKNLLSFPWLIKQLGAESLLWKKANNYLLTEVNITWEAEAELYRPIVSRDYHYNT